MDDLPSREECEEGKGGRKKKKIRISDTATSRTSGMDPGGVENLEIRAVRVTTQESKTFGSHIMPTCDCHEL